MFGYFRFRRRSDFYYFIVSLTNPQTGAFGLAPLRHVGCLSIKFPDRLYVYYIIGDYLFIVSLWHSVVHTRTRGTAVCVRGRFENTCSRRRRRRRSLRPGYCPIPRRRPLPRAAPPPFCRNGRRLARPPTMGGGHVVEEPRFYRDRFVGIDSAYDGKNVITKTYRGS